MMCSIDDASDNHVLCLNDCYGNSIDDIPLHEIARDNSKVVYTCGYINLDWMTRKTLRVRIPSLVVDLTFDIREEGVVAESRIRNTFPEHVVKHPSVSMLTGSYRVDGRVIALVELHMCIPEEV